MEDRLQRRTWGKRQRSGVTERILPLFVRNFLRSRVENKSLSPSWVKYSEIKTECSVEIRSARFTKTPS